MTQVILPNTFSPNTVIESAKVMANQTALRDVINGQLEGGATVDGNIKANGITAREIADLVLPNGIAAGLQPGIIGSGDCSVSPGAGLVLNYASGTLWATDSGSVIGAAAALVPAIISGSSVTVGANASGLPRIDQVIATLTGWGTATVSVLQGVATTGATLDNRVGAAALPASSIRLADILIPTGFAGPFVVDTNIRDRRPVARGAHAFIRRAVANYSTTATSVVLVDSVNLNPRLECSGVPLIATLFSLGAHSAANGRASYQVGLDGAVIDNTQATATYVTAGSAWGVALSFPIDAPTPGSHQFPLMYRAIDTGTTTLFATSTQALRYVVQEVPALA